MKSHQARYRAPNKTMKKISMSTQPSEMLCSVYTLQGYASAMISFYRATTTAVQMAPLVPEIIYI
jgi:hypothetical protein